RQRCVDRATFDIERIASVIDAARAAELKEVRSQCRIHVVPIAPALGSPQRLFEFPELLIIILADLEHNAPALSPSTRNSQAPVTLARAGVLPHHTLASDFRAPVRRASKARIINSLSVSTNAKLESSFCLKKPDSS